jgi:hypothetical protein
MTKATIKAVTQAEVDVIAERRRQQGLQDHGGEAYTPRFDDDTNDDSELAQAAVVYALGATYSDYARKMMLQQAHAGRPTFAGERWPASWDFAHYKPTTPRRDLVKAGALILAEIERLDRKAEREAREAAESYDTEQRMLAEYGEK